MKALITVLMVLSLSLLSCGSVPKISPEYKGIDPSLKSYVDDYKWWAKQHGLVFTREVTMGFKKINQGLTIGLCNYGATWREIDIDSDWWSETTYPNFDSALQKTALVFHELTHCYCARGHDYGEHKHYPEGLEKRIRDALEWVKHGGEKPGYWDDGCPVSLMYPVVVDTDCMRSHYNEYITEMFDRCSPY